MQEHIWWSCLKKKAYIQIRPSKFVRRHRRQVTHLLTVIIDIGVVHSKKCRVTTSKLCGPCTCTGDGGILYYIAAMTPTN